MARYKLIQDIEAEDHILGPLTLRQFIFALIAVFLFYMCYFVVSKGVAFMLVIFLPPALFFGFFALPFGRDQPTEIWALAKINFLFKNRKRVWNQSGVKELVTINVPKKIERVLTDGLSQAEVMGRLNALASTLDTRGWATRHVEAPGGAFKNPLEATADDRLLRVVDDSVVNDYDLAPEEDVLDIDNNPLSHKFEDMIAEKADERRSKYEEMLNASEEAPVAEDIPDSAWFDDKGGNAPESEPKIIKRQNLENSHMRTLKKVEAPAPVTTPQDPAIINLSKSNDLNVSTLARQANQQNGGELQNGEVTISLH